VNVNRDYNITKEWRTYIVKNQKAFPKNCLGNKVKFFRYRNKKTKAGCRIWSWSNTFGKYTRRIESFLRYKRKNLIMDFAYFAFQEIGRLDFWGNNAGSIKDDLVLRMREEKWDSQGWKLQHNLYFYTIPNRYVQHHRLRCNWLMIMLFEWQH